MAVAVALLGPRNKAASSRTTHRWGAKGSLAIEVAGPDRGMWFDHEAGKGGDLLGLIQRVNGCSFPDAVAWACHHTDISEPPRRETRATRTKGAPASHQTAPDAEGAR